MCESTAIKASPEVAALALSYDGLRDHRNARPAGVVLEFHATHGQPLRSASTERGCMVGVQTRTGGIKIVLGKLTSALTSSRRTVPRADSVRLAHRW